MKKKVTYPSKFVPIAILSLFYSSTIQAQKKTEVSIGADIVSSYIWRGQDCGGVSIQPSITISKSGFFAEAWGSVGTDQDDIKEVDFTIGYETGNFTASITDYWLDEGSKYFTYGARDTNHNFEATLNYDFGPFSFNWSTYFAGADYYKAKNNGTFKRAYSSYAEVNVPFILGGVDFSAEVGLTPWEGAYAESLNVVNIGLTAGKNISITKTFEIPVFAKVVVNPNTEKTFFVLGATF